METLALVPQKKGDDEDASNKDRVLLYPSAEISISLDIPRAKSMFVIVKVRRFCFLLILLTPKRLGQKQKMIAILRTKLTLIWGAFISYRKAGLRGTKHSSSCQNWHVYVTNLICIVDSNPLHTSPLNYSHIKFDSTTFDPPKFSSYTLLTYIITDTVLTLTQTKVLDEVLELGRTDSRETSGTERLNFDKKIEITYFSGEWNSKILHYLYARSSLITTSYYFILRCSLTPHFIVGVDDNQMVIFEIMDGDLMTSSSFGYIFATVVIPVGNLFKGENWYDIF